jgi:hypothetical protein
VGRYRYLLRLEGSSPDPTSGFAPDDIYFSPDDPHNPRDREQLPIGKHITSDDGIDYVIVGRAVRDIPDLVIGMLFVRPVE